MKKYRFIEDPGHGWLEVPTTELAILGIRDQISAFSYLTIDGAFTYLEEDCDLSVFAEAKGWNTSDPCSTWPTVRVYQENTFIRDLPHYRP